MNGAPKPKTPQVNLLDELVQPALDELDPTHIETHDELVIRSTELTLAGLHVSASSMAPAAISARLEESLALAEATAKPPTVQEIAKAVNDELCAPTSYKCKTSVLGSRMEFIDPEDVNSFVGYRVRRYDYEASKKKPAYHSVGSDVIFGDCDRRITWHTGSCDDDVNQSQKIRVAIRILTELADLLDANEVAK